MASIKNLEEKLKNIRYDPNYPDKPGDVTQKELLEKNPEGELWYRASQDQDKNPDSRADNLLPPEKVPSLGVAIEE